MNRNYTFLSIFLAAGIASAGTSSPTPKPAVPKSSAPAAVAAAGQNGSRAPQSSGETQVLRLYKGPSYFDADLALKLRDRLVSKPSTASPAQTASPAATQRPVINAGGLASKN